MAEPRFIGSGVALVTPFDRAGVHESALRALVRFHHEEGTDALLVCGSTGEAATMSAAEQRTAADIVIDENAGRLPVIVGCGGSDTSVVARLAVQAADAGADAVLVSAPPPPSWSMRTPAACRSSSGAAAATRRSSRGWRCRRRRWVRTPCS